MTPEESLEVLREAHREPVDEAHFAAVRARVLTEIAGKRRGVRRVWWFAFAAMAAAVLVAGLWVKEPLPVRVVRRVTPAAPSAGKRLAASAPVSVDNRVSSARRRAGPKPGPRGRPRPEGLARKRGVVGPTISSPLVVKMVTDDPDVVIYWITEGTGE